MIFFFFYSRKTVGLHTFVLRLLEVRRSSSIDRHVNFGVGEKKIVKILNARIFILSTNK